MFENRGLFLLKMDRGGKIVGFVKDYQKLSIIIKDIENNRETFMLPPYSS